PAAQDLDPVQTPEAVGQGLGPYGVVQLREGVVVLHEADAVPVELACQPVVAVGVGLEGEGDPGLQAQVDQAELGVEEVEVEDALGPGGEGQARGATAVAELDGAAGLLTAQDADEPLAEAPVADGLLDDLLLSVAALEVVVGGLVLLGELLGVVNELVGFLLQPREEVLARDAEDAVHEAVEVGLAAEGQVAFEDDSIGAGEDAEEGRSELDEERAGAVHGVLLRKGASATPF